MYGVNDDLSSLTPDQIEAILRARQMMGNAPPPPDPYGRPQPLPPPSDGGPPPPSSGFNMGSAADDTPMPGDDTRTPAQRAAGFQSGSSPLPGQHIPGGSVSSPGPSSGPYGAPATGGQPDIQKQIADALAAYSTAAGQPMPKMPAGYGFRRGVLGALASSSNVDYENAMLQRQAQIQAAEAKYKGLLDMEQRQAQAQMREAQAGYYGRRSEVDDLLKTIANPDSTDAQVNAATRALRAHALSQGHDLDNPKQPKLSDEEQAYQEAKAANPKLTLLEFHKQWANQQEPGNWAPWNGSDGNQYLVNSKTGQMKPLMGPGGASSAGGSNAAPASPAPPVTPPSTAIGGILDAALSGAGGGQPAPSAAPTTPAFALSKPGGGGGVGQMSDADIKNVADGIESGKIPPETKGYYRNSGRIVAELAKRGTDLSTLQNEWKATQRFVQTANGDRQVRMRQNIDMVNHSLDNIEGIYSQLRSILPDTGFKSLNRASLQAMKQLPGQAGALAQALDGNIADLTGELGNVVMGGNSPTDHALSLASQNLNGSWNEDSFHEAVGQIRKNVGFRKSSLENSAPAVFGGQSRYAPQAQSGVAASGSGGSAVARAPQGTPDGPVMYKGQPAVVRQGVIYAQ